MSMVYILLKEESRGTDSHRGYGLHVEERLVVGITQR